MNKNTKTCVTCREEKSLDEFGKNKSKIDGLQKYCRICGRKADKRHYTNNKNRKQNISNAQTESKNRNREFIVKYLLSHPCIDCGESDPLFLDFDHVRDKKIKNISDMSKEGCSISTLKKEIEKCEVRCLKCHRIKTAKTFGWYDDFRQLISRCDPNWQGTSLVN